MKEDAAGKCREVREVSNPCISEKFKRQRNSLQVGANFFPEFPCFPAASEKGKAMTICWNRPSLAMSGPASEILQLDQIDRRELGLADYIAPSASGCIVVQPKEVTHSYSELLLAPWWENAGRYNSHGTYIGDVRVYVSMEGQYWVIEVTDPNGGSAPRLLGARSKLIVTRSPGAAAQIAKMCIPNAAPPFEWISYW